MWQKLPLSLHVLGAFKHLTVTYADQESMWKLPVTTAWHDSQLGRRSGCLLSAHAPRQRCHASLALLHSLRSLGRPHLLILTQTPPQAQKAGPFAPPAEVPGEGS